MIKVENLTKTFGPKVAVNDVSFTVQRGEVLGFLGAMSSSRADAQTVLVYGDITAAATGNPVAARLYLHSDADGKWHFPKSVPPFGLAVRYEKRSGFNTNATEFHTTLSAHQWVAELPPESFLKK